MKNKIKKGDIVHIDQQFDRQDADLRPSPDVATPFTVVAVDGDYIDFVNDVGQKDTTHCRRCLEYWGISREASQVAQPVEPEPVEAEPKAPPKKAKK